MDYDAYHAINARGPHFVDEAFRYLANDLTALIIVLVALLFLIPWRRHQLARRQGTVAATAAAAIALLINQPIAHAVDRARPYVAHHGSAHLLIAPLQRPSFPATTRPAPSRSPPRSSTTASPAPFSWPSRSCSASPASTSAPTIRATFWAARRSASSSPSPFAGRPCAAGSSASRSAAPQHGSGSSATRAERSEASAGAPEG
jgi:hypothetical protein